MNVFFRFGGALSRALCLLTVLSAMAPAAAQTSPPPLPMTVAPASPADALLSHLQKQAHMLEIQAAAGAKAGQYSHAQLLYGQAAVLYHREARLARQQAQALAAAGNASAAADKHTLALAADNHFLRSMASEVALIKKQAAAPPVVKAVKPAAPKPPVVVVKPVPRAPALVKAPPAKVAAKVIKPRAKPRIVPQPLFTRPLLVLVRGRASVSMLNIAKFAVREQKALRWAKSVKMSTLTNIAITPAPVVPVLPIAPPMPAVIPPAVTPAPVIADPLTALPWTAVQEVLVDRTFENGAPVLIHVSGSWVFHADKTWEREVRTANGIIFPAHGTYSMMGDTLILSTHQDAGGNQITRYRFALSSALKALSLVTSTTSGYERYLLYAQGTENLPRRPEDLDAFAPRP